MGYRSVLIRLSVLVHQKQRNHKKCRYRYFLPQISTLGLLIILLIPGVCVARGRVVVVSRGWNIGLTC